MSAFFLFCIAVPGVGSEEQPITMNMRDASVRSVIEWMADISGRNFIVDPSVDGSMTVLSKEALSVDQAFEVFLNALALNGFSASLDGNNVTIIPAARASQNHTAVLDSFDGHSSSEKAVHIFQTRSVSAADVVKELQPLVGEHGAMSHFPASNTVMLADRVDNIKRIRALIQRLDQRGQMDIDVQPLKHVEADAALRSLQQLLSSTATADSSMAPGLASDARSNSVLVSGSPEQRQQIADLLGKLDSPLARQGSTEVLYIHYLNATELVPILESLAPTDAQAGMPQAVVSVQASEAANALILTAPAPLLEEMKRVVSEIDVQRRQVLLEAIIVEVSDDVIDDLGVQWNTEFNGRGTEAATNFDLTAPGTDASGRLLSENSVLGRGFTLGYYRNGSLRGLLSALSRTNDANLLSTPSIVALDNEEAEILVGSNVPVITGQQTSQASPSDDPFTTLERRDIGVSLKITPQINQQDSMTLDILQEVENISLSDVAEDLIFDKRSIKTKVLVDDDEVLVLGGLTRQDTQESVDRVPVLGYIPILGKLFQSSSEQSVRSNLMVFIHPRILDKKETRAAISQQRYKDIQEKQRQAAE